MAKLSSRERKALSRAKQTSDQRINELERNTEWKKKETDFVTTCSRTHDRDVDSARKKKQRSIQRSKLHAILDEERVSFDLTEFTSETNFL